MAETFARTDPTPEIVRKLASPETGTLLPVRVVKKALSFTGTANGSLVSWQNPNDVAVIAAIAVDVSTAGTGTAGVDIGVGTLGGSGDNLLDAGRVDTVAVVSPFGTGAGANGRPWRKLTAKGGTLDYITGKANDLDATAAGAAYIIYIPLV